MKIDRSTIFYGTLLLTATGLCSQLFGFFYRICLSRLIGAEVMGLYQLVMPVYSVILSITATGLTAAVSSLTSEYKARGNWQAIGQVLRHCLFLMAGLIILPAAAVLLLSDPISVYLLGDARTQLGLLLLLPCIFLTGVENLHKNVFYGAGLVRPPAFTELLEQVVRTCCVLGLLLLFLPQTPERTVGLIVTGMVLCEIFSSCTLVMLYRRWRRRMPAAQGGSAIPRRTLNRRIAHIAVPISATTLLGNLMGSACAVLIPQKLVSGGMTVSQAVSSFGVMFGMTMPLLSLPTCFVGALSLVLVPRLAESATLGHTADIHRRISKAMLGTSVIMLPAAAFLCVLGPTLGAALFQNPSVGSYMAPMAIGVVLVCYQSILFSSLHGLNRQPTTARISLLCGAVELGIVFFTVGIPSVGLGGYVAAYLISTILGVLLSGSALWRASGLRPQLFQWITAPGLSALLMGLNINLLFPILQAHGLTPLASAAACLVFGGVLYLAALHAQGIRLSRLFRLSA